MPSLTRDLHVIARCGNQFKTALLSGQGISAPQSSYILHICADPGMSQEQLANALHVNPSNVTRQLSTLESLEFIKRNSSLHDKRLIEIYPTQKALDAVPSIRQVNQRWYEYLTQDFASESLAALEEMLEKMRLLASVWDKMDELDK